jgi:hypothetical protein
MADKALGKQARVSAYRERNHICRVRLLYVLVTPRLGAKFYAVFYAKNVLKDTKNDPRIASR